MFCKNANLARPKGGSFVDLQTPQPMPAFPIGNLAFLARFPPAALAAGFHLGVMMKTIGNISFTKIPRILIAKCGLDGHDRGAKFIAKALCDAGMEIIYTGIRQTPHDIARTAVQEDVDLIGLSILSGAHNSIFPKLLDELKQQSAGDIPVFGGGVIPDEDIPSLKAAGVKAVFTPGATVENIIIEIKKILEG